MNIGLSLLASAMLAGVATTASAQALTLTFDRTGTDASSVTVSTSGIEGATAQLNSCSPAFRPTAGSITSSILCPNANANTSPTITFELTVSGLPADYSFTNIGLDIHALNGANGYQEHNDNQVRQWNVNTRVNNQDFYTFSNIDIAAGINPGESARHKIWEATVQQAVSVSSSMTLTITVTKGTTNGGCFFGLSSITFSNPANLKATAIAEFETYTATRSKRLQMLDLWNGAETAATEITLADDAEDWDAELENKKQQFDAAEDALYAALDNRNFVFRKNKLSQNESHVVSFISSNATGLYATNAPDASSIWRAHRTEGRNFKFENEATGRWFGSGSTWQQNQQIPVALTAEDAVEYSLDYIPAGTQASEEQLKGSIVLSNTIFANASSNADKCALHHGDSRATNIVCWMASADNASHRKSSWHASILSDEAARAMAASYLTGTGFGQYTITAGEPIQPATLTHANAADEIARYENCDATFALNLPATGSYISFNGADYFLTEANTLCNYESGRYLTDTLEETDADNATAFTFSEGKISHYDIASADNNVLTDATISKTELLPVSSTSEFITFIAPVAGSFSPTTAEIYVAYTSADKITITAASTDVTYAAGTGFIIRTDGQTLEFTIADTDENAVSDFTETFTGTYEAYTFHAADNNMGYYTIMPGQDTEAELYSDNGNTVKMTLLNDGDQIAPNTAIIQLDNSPSGQYPATWEINLNGDTPTTGTPTLTAPADKSADTVFDISGRRVRTIRQAGIYITDGKKIVIR